MSTSMSPPVQPLPKLSAQTYRLDVPPDELPQAPRDSSQSAGAERFQNPVLCLAVLPLHSERLGKEALWSVLSLVRRDGPLKFVGNMKFGIKKLSETNKVSVPHYFRHWI